MRHLLLILFIFSAMIIVHGQSVDFAPVGAKWWVNQIILEPIVADSFVIVEVTHEEMKAGELCRVITNMNGCGLPNPAHVFTRNDSVFFYSEVTDQFELLYDFTAVAGSSWTVKGLLGITDHEVKVKDVKEEVFLGNFLKIWYIEDSQAWGKWIFEKVGSGWYIGPTYSEDCPNPQGGFNAHGVRCYEDEDGLIKFTGNTECDFFDDIGSVDGQDQKVLFQLSPNPARDVIKIELSEGAAQSSSYQIQLVSLVGQKLYHGSISPFANSHNIPLISIPPGFYVVIISDGSGRQWQEKVLVE